MALIFSFLKPDTVAPNAELSPVADWDLNADGGLLLDG